MVSHRRPDMRPPGSHPRSVCTCQSPTTPGRPGARTHAPVRVAFRDLKRVGARNKAPFAAQWLAYALPCRRFACTLTNAGARLRADVDRYSFIVCRTRTDYSLPVSRRTQIESRLIHWLYFFKMMTGRVNSRLLPLAS